MHWEHKPYKSSHIHAHMSCKLQQNDALRFKNSCQYTVSIDYSYSRGYSAMVEL